MRTHILFFIFLFLISCLGQISSDLYLPALPTIRSAFNTSDHWLQLSLAVYMLGFSISHLFYGPISDHVGRKKPLAVGLVICMIGTLVCQFSSHIAVLITGRFIQGAGAGSGAALFLSITNDVYQGNRLAKIASLLNISRVVLLACSPLIGGYLLRAYYWQACFIFLFVYTAICFIGSLTVLKETNQQLNRNAICFFQIVKNIAMLCTHRRFLTYTFCVMLAFGGILAWLTTLPFLLQDVVHLTPVQFGWVAAVAGLFFIVGGFINAVIVERFGFHNMLMIGLLIMLIGSCVMLFFGLIHWIDTLVIMIPVVIYIVGSSFVFANAYAGAMGSFSESAGTTAAVFGFLQIIGGAISSFLMSLMHTYDQIPLAIVLMLSAVLALLVLKFQTSISS